jgi:hypothetical protein
MEIEIPFHALACLLGVSKGRHFEFKYKPLIVSNETGMLPVIWEGYHLVNSQTLNAIQTFEDLVSAFRSRRVSDRMKLTALASAPEEFIEVLVGLGGFNYENILTRLDKLSGEMDSEEYLRYLGTLLRQTPLVTELWR